MITTPMGAARHYTKSFAEFCDDLEENPGFARWFAALEQDVQALASEESWDGRGPFPAG